MNNGWRNLKEAESPEELLRHIDWSLLREQKEALLRILDMAAYNELIQAEENKLEGILNMIDALQDCAVDYLGYLDEDVFNLTKDEEDENS